MKIESKNRSITSVEHSRKPKPIIMLLIWREMSALYCVKKFKYYILGNHLETSLITNHKPLMESAIIHSLPIIAIQGG